MDIKSAQYSIHQISLMGESLDKKPVGTWFGPNTVAQVLRKFCKFDPSDDIAVHVAMDNTLDESERNTIGILYFFSSPSALV